MKKKAKESVFKLLLLIIYILFLQTAMAYTWSTGYLGETCQGSTVCVNGGVDQLFSTTMPTNDCTTSVTLTLYQTDDEGDLYVNGIRIYGDNGFSSPNGNRCSCTDCGGDNPSTSGCLDINYPNIGVGSFNRHGGTTVSMWVKDMCGDCRWARAEFSINDRTDCGSSYWAGSPYCSGGHVYDTYTSRGCDGGSCYNNGASAQIYQNCGTSDWTGSAHCSADLLSVVQDYITRGCSGGACTSSTETDKVKQTCSAGTICNEGVCTNYYTYCNDRDGDGRGTTDPSERTISFSATVPPGNSTYCDDCDDSILRVAPNATEDCNNRDDDCDTVIDEGLSGTGGCNQVGECSGATITCAAGVWSTCTKLPSTEICDGKDNDCNGINDDNNVCCGTANGQYYSSAPTTGLCDSVSTPTTVFTSEGVYYWNCTIIGVKSLCTAYSSGNDATLYSIGELKLTQTTTYNIVTSHTCGMPNKASSSNPYTTTCTLSNFDQTHCCSGNTCTNNGAVDSIADRDGLWYYSSAFDASNNLLDNPSDAKIRRYAFSCAPICKKYDTCAGVGTVNGNCTYRNESAGNQPSDIEHEGNWHCDGDDTGGMHCDGNGTCVTDCRDVDVDGYGVEPDANFHAISCTAHSANLDCNDSNWFIKPVTGHDVCNGRDDDCDGVIDNRIYGGGVARDACGKLTGSCASGFDYYSIPDVRQYSNNSVYLFLSDYSKSCYMSTTYFKRISMELYTGLFPTYLSGPNYHFNTTQSWAYSSNGIWYNNLSNCINNILGRRPLATDVFHIIPYANNTNNQPFEGTFWTPGYGSWFNNGSFNGVELTFSPEAETGAKCTNGGDDDCDGESDYDNQIWNAGTATGTFKLEHGDNDCPVGIDSISVSNLNPLLNSFINVTCDANQGSVNSVFAYIDYNKDRKYSSRTDYICNWTSSSFWNSDKVTFTNCQVQQEGVYNVSCSVYNNSATKPYDRSYQTGPDKFIQINITLCPNGTRWIAPNTCENITANCTNGAIDIGEECDGSIFWLYDSCNDIIPGSSGTLTCNSQCKIDYNCVLDQKCDNDGIAEVNETCDNNDFKGKTCFNFGYLNGNLRCNRDCTIDTGNCSNSSFNDNKCPNGILDDFTEKCDTNQFGGATCDTLFPGTSGRLNCTPSCAIEPHCTSTLTFCGNNNVEFGEVCDGTDLNGSNCTSLGFDAGTLFCNSGSCTLNTSRCYYIINPKCPNGNIDSGEECDTNAFNTTCSNYGFTYGNLGCTVNCTVDYSQCYNTLPTNSQICGDGYMNATRGEECDGNDFGILGASCSRANYDAGLLNCTSACKIDTKNCYNLPDLPNCPNGVIDLGENCDGGIPNGLTCENYTFQKGNLRCVNCNIDSSECYNDSIIQDELRYCGNGIIESGLGETCDALNLNGKTCKDFGFVGGNLFCDRTKCICDTSQCYNVPPVFACGDGKLDAGEQCDGAGTFTSSCTAAYPGRFDAGSITCVNCMLQTTGCTMTPASACNNNGIIDLPSEACDGTDFGGQNCTTRGLGSGSLTCTNCVVGTSCSITPTQPLCGNGIVDAGETCDKTTQKTCSDFNMQNGFVYCNSTCQLVTRGCYNTTLICNNNGIVEPGETCDGGVGSWGCDDFGFTGSGPLTCNNCQLNVSKCLGIIPIAIGSGGDIISFPEMDCNFNGICEDFESCVCSDCDNKQDHCVAGLRCSKMVCAPTTCHDGIVDPGEECDDNNWNDNDACANCMNATCGDGYRWFGYEECDLGVSLNGVPGTKCSIDCFNLSKGFNINRQLVKNYSNFEAANAIDAQYTQKVRFHLLSADLKRKPMDYLIANPFLYSNSKIYEDYISPDECFNELKPGETCLQLWFVNITDTTDREIYYLPEDIGITLINPLNFTGEFNNTMVTTSKTPALRIKIIPWEEKFIPGGKGVLRRKPNSYVFDWTWANKTAYDANPGASGIWTCKEGYHVNDSTEPYNAPKDCIPDDITRPS